MRATDICPVTLETFRFHCETAESLTTSNRTVETTGNIRKEETSTVNQQRFDFEKLFINRSRRVERMKLNESDKYLE